MLLWILEFMYLQISVFIFLGFISKSRIAGSYDSSIFNFLRNFHAGFLFLFFFYSGFTNLHSHQQCTWVLYSPHSCQHLFLVFLTVAILADVSTLIFHSSGLSSFDRQSWSRGFGSWLHILFKEEDMLILFQQHLSW